MRTYSIEQADDLTLSYADRKRWWWFLSLMNPLLPLVGVVGYLTTQQNFWLLVPLILMFVVAPALDWLFGEDQNNPPEALVPQLEDDPYYRLLTYATVPLHYIAFICVAVFIGTHTIPWWGFLCDQVHARC